MERRNRMMIMISIKKPSFSKIRLQLTFASKVKLINTMGKIPTISLALIAYLMDRHHTPK